MASCRRHESISHAEARRSENFQSRARRPTPKPPRTSVTSAVKPVSLSFPAVGGWRLSTAVATGGLNPSANICDGRDPPAQPSSAAGAACGGFGGKKSPIPSHAATFVFHTPKSLSCRLGHGGAPQVRGCVVELLNYHRQLEFELQCRVVDIVKRGQRCRKTKTSQLAEAKARMKIRANRKRRNGRQRAR